MALLNTLKSHSLCRYTAPVFPAQIWSPCPSSPHAAYPRKCREGSPARVWWTTYQQMLFYGRGPAWAVTAIYELFRSLARGWVSVGNLKKTERCMKTKRTFRVVYWERCCRSPFEEPRWSYSVFACLFIYFIEQSLTLSPSWSWTWCNAHASALWELKWRVEPPCLG